MGLKWSTLTAVNLSDDWVGLEIRSQWLQGVAGAYAEAVGARPGEDALRLKDWLHLSLAYGVVDLTQHGVLAAEKIDPTASVDWEVGLWERHGSDTWTRLV